MMIKFPSTCIAATSTKKAGNSLTDPRRKKQQLEFDQVSFLAEKIGRTGFIKSTPERIRSAGCELWTSAPVSLMDGFAPEKSCWRSCPVRKVNKKNINQEPILRLRNLKKAAGEAVQ
jgi:hypothetical protein